MNGQSLIAASALLLATSPALAAVTVTQQAGPAPTYSTTLNFDEVGGPSGGPAPLDSWNVSHAITVADAGVGGGLIVDNFNGSFPWLPNNNAVFGAFGVYFNFGTDLTALSLQAWDTSGPSSPFGGGMGVILLNDGVEVGGLVFTPAWGGVGNTWYHITTTAGSVFDEVRVVGFGFPADTWVDDLSWNVVPGPGGFVMFAVAGLIGTRRRRS